MLPSLVVPSAHRLPGTGAVPGTAGPYSTGLACMGASRGVACCAHGTNSLQQPTVPCPWTPKCCSIPRRRDPQVEGKIIDRGP
jgi:hypothetical protein